MDTIGTNVERTFNIIKYHNGTRKVSLVARCPLLRGVLYKECPLCITSYDSHPDGKCILTPPQSSIIDRMSLPLGPIIALCCL